MGVQATKGRKQRGEGRPGQRGGSRRKRIAKLLRTVETRLDIDNSKVTLGDYIRLMQLERELEEEEQPGEIIVTWKDPAEKRSESK